ncbi:MAG TPA: peptidase C39 [Planctomycetaceae bacterium]|nr:peptidase C39 [Planctomycetaceae bacterium]
MGFDLWIAIAIMTVLAVLAATLVVARLYSDAGQWTMLGLTVSAFGMVMFLLYGSGQLFWARVIPSSAAIIYSNFAAIFAAMAAGWAWRLPDTPAWRRATLATLLAISSVVAILMPLLSIALRPPPPGGDAWRQGVAMQTSWATCSPAAAATLFRGEGITVSEAEMVPLCLTDYAGTPTLGLYRGVKLVANRYKRRVVLLDGGLTRLVADDDWPVLLSVRLPFGVEDRRFVEQWGWIPGMGHSVVIMGRTSNGDFIVGDPAMGLEIWSKADLDLLWSGVGMRVE